MVHKKDFKWRSEFSIGIEKIDKQHKRLLKQFEGLPRLLLVDEEERSAIFKSILMKIVEYLQFHFFTEERLMQDINYPGFEEHKNHHIDIFKKIYILAHNTDKIDSAAMKSIIEFLSEWYRLHFLGMDKEMGDYFAQGSAR